MRPGPETTRLSGGTTIVAAGEPCADALPAAGLRAVPLDSPLLAWALLAVAAELVFLAFWPGIVHWDMSQIVADAHRGFALDWWTGLGTLALRAWFAAGLGLPLVWAGVVIANVAGIYGCLRVVLPRVPAGGATLACVMFPPVYGQLAALSRDSACVGFTLLALAGLARWMRSPSGAAGRRRWLPFAFACALCAAAVRQNGIAVVVAVALCGLLGTRGVTRRRALGAVLVAVVAGVAAFATLRIAMPALGVRSVSPERMTFVYDLAALSAGGQDLFPQRALRPLPPGGAAPAEIGEAALRRHFRAWGVTSIRGVTKMDVANTALAARETPLLRRAWLHAIAQEPMAYVGERLRLYTALLGIAGQPSSPPHGFFYGYQRLDQPDNYGHPLASPAAYRAASAVLDRFIGPRAILPLDRPWAYLFVLGAALVCLWRRRAPERRFAAAIAVTVAVNQLLLLGAVMSASFRYEYLLVPASAVCLLYALAAINPGRSRLLRDRD
jgi:hypothetical protein